MVYALFVTLPFNEAEKVLEYFKQKKKGRYPLITKATKENKKKGKKQDHKKKKIENIMFDCSIV